MLLVTIFATFFSKNFSKDLDLRETDVTSLREIFLKTFN